MKKTDKRKLLAHIERAVPGLSGHGNMAIVLPHNGILRGIFLADSIDRSVCYAESFVQPLFEPPPFILSFNVGERLGGPSRTWSLDEGPELAALAARDGPPFWRHSSSAEELATWLSTITPPDLYVLRARGLALIVAEQYSEAVRALDNVCAEIGSATGWAAEMRQQCESLRALVEENPSVALETLRKWEQENVRALRLS